MHRYAWNASGVDEPPIGWKGKTDALRFDSGQYYELLHEADLMDSFIASQWNVMGEADPQHHVKLVVEEWGVSGYAARHRALRRSSDRPAEHHAGCRTGRPYSSTRSTAMRTRSAWRV